MVVRLSTGFDAAGLYSLAMAIFGIFSPIGQYRMYTVQISDVNKDNKLGEYFAFRLVTIAISLALCGTYALATVSLDALWVTLAYFTYRSTALGIDIFHACDQSNHRMDLIGKSLAVQGFFSIVVFCAAFYLTSDLTVTLILMALAMLAIGVLYDYPRTKEFEDLVIGISYSKAKRLLISCLPIVVAAVAANAATSLPRQVLSGTFGDAELGIYASVAAPVAIIQMSASYIYNPLMTYFAEAYSNRDKGAFWHLLKRCIAGMAALCALSLVGVALFGEPLLAILYGQQLSNYVYLMYPLMLLAVTTGFMWFMNDLLICLRSFKGVFWGSAVAFIASLCGLPLIFAFEMNGVTFDCMVSATCGIAFMAFWLHRILSSEFKQ